MRQARCKLEQNLEAAQEFHCEHFTKTTLSKICQNEHRGQFPEIGKLDAKGR